MHPIQIITIPQPCQQSWHQMEANNNGRYCDHCCKTVVDFSIMSNNDIIAHLATNTNVCGRFEKRQLEDFSTKSFDKHSWKPLRKYMLMAASVIGLAPLSVAKANVLQHPVDSVHKKQVVKHIGVAQVRVLKRKALTVTSFKYNSKVTVKNDATKVNRYPCFPYDDGIVGKVAYTPAIANQVKNFRINRSVDTVLHVLGGISIKGIPIEKTEREVDKQMLYDLGIK